ncbi:MAG: YbbL transporter ATPbinding protein [Geminicoccaceae bacterium]|jgi:phosphate-transporting ATPase|nr:YbbL transporter ATPbinding protein [Geminicoccaceae bacterium]
MLVVRSLRGPGVALERFELAAGACVAVRGPSGAGKTLLLRALADLDPSQGEVTLDGAGRDAMPAPRWRRLVTYLAAEPAWWAESVGEHFADWPAAAPLVAALGLPEDCRSWPVARASTGERQRLALARGLAHRPRVVLLDEPTSGLDEDARHGAETLLLEHFRSGLSALWVTHDDAQARRVAERSLAVSDGRAQEAAA